MERLEARTDRLEHDAETASAVTPPGPRCQKRLCSFAPPRCARSSGARSLGGFRVRSGGRNGRAERPGRTRTRNPASLLALRLSSLARPRSLARSKLSTRRSTLTPDNNNNNNNNNNNHNNKNNNNNKNRTTTTTTTTTTARPRTRTRTRARTKTKQET